MKENNATHQINHHGLEITDINGERFFKINEVEKMRPFLMTVVSPGDHWLFISSNGGLTAGRRNPEMALFPYDTDDKITEAAVHTGSNTLIRIKHKGRSAVWQPFAINGDEYCSIQRNLYKNASGNKVIFEEKNHELNLSFSYMWTFSEQFGFVKESTIQSYKEETLNIDILDGVLNIMPSGVSSQLQIQRSTLVDAYKRQELDPQTGLCMFTLSAMIIDKAEPAEALLATVAWTTGMKPQNTLLCQNQIKAFKKGEPIVTENDICGEKGAYLNHFNVTLENGQKKQWHQVFDVHQSHADVANLRALLLSGVDQEELVKEDIQHTTFDLKKLVASSDGYQKSADALTTSRHFMNVLFNIMRGGLFDENYLIHREDFKDYLIQSNKNISARFEHFIDHLPDTFQFSDLYAQVSDMGDSDLFRLTTEYLPLFFSRRHGDPSRPWNYFSIDTRDEDGNKTRNYEGNWRDIFQNWEALAYSYPQYLEGFITKFLNASTIDGYNPYRISREGIDWEIEEEEDPWSYIGYWGDHQIVYLLKLLELSSQCHPDHLRKLTNQSLFVYANVPYRIKSYHDTLLDPQNTIDFAHEIQKLVEERSALIGSDGKLVWDEDDLPVKATLAEKLLVTFATKLCNFVPEAGIWLNTQRPEWNDANNALVGNGVSMVTLCYLRRYIIYLFSFFRDCGEKELKLNRPVAQMIEAIEKVLSSHVQLLGSKIDDQSRKVLMDELGAISEQYRALAYTGFRGNIDELPTDRLLSMLELSLRFCDHSIRANKRSDGLYHSYNILMIGKDKAGIRHLYEMLEGQVAVLSSGLLSAEESLSLLNSLKDSSMYRSDQYSYMLYPNRRLNGFLEKNTIPSDQAESCGLFKQLAEAGNHRLIEKDVHGHFHFSRQIHNKNNIREILNALSYEGWDEEVRQYGEQVIEIFESLFDHSAFTGRSGTFFGYEGLGSIYWHMVSKLLLAVQETIHRFVAKGIHAETFGRLVEHYYEIRAGIGVNKSPELYGAFPTDAYSHTPMNTGAQQPGMTGQVKEDIINRWAELGVFIHDGCLHFEPRILRKSEFLSQSDNFQYIDLSYNESTINLEAGMLAFTVCQVPVVYRYSEDVLIKVFYTSGREEQHEGSKLPKEVSSELFIRSGKVIRIEVHCMPHL